MKVELKPQAIKDLRGLRKQEAARIAAKLAELENGLTGDIKRLTNFTPEYRLALETTGCFLRLKKLRLSCTA